MSKTQDNTVMYVYRVIDTTVVHVHTYLNDLIVRVTKVPHHLHGIFGYCAQRYEIEARATMEAIAPELPIKLKVDVSIGENWGEL